MPLTSYDELGSAVQRAAGSIREALLDFIENVSPADTPLYNNLSQISVSAGFIEHLEDTLPAAGTNANTEGAGASDPTLTTPTRNYAIVQNFQKHWQVSGRQEAITHAGMTSPISYQAMKAAKEFKNDLELALHRGSAVSGTNSVAPQFAGMLNKITTYATSSSGTTLTEVVYNDLITLTYATPVNLRETYANMLVKRTINGYTTNTQRFLPSKERRQVNIVDVYESESGIQAIYKSRYQLQAASKTAAGNSFIVIDPDYFVAGVLRPVREKTLGLDGDRERRLLVGEYTLLARSEKAGVAGLGYVAYIV